MKAIINGKRYNTETAEHIAKFHNGLSHSDFNYIYETLYRTKKGNWFLHGEGGAATKYSKAAGNMSSGGEHIVPMNDDEVKTWLENTEHPEVIEKYFPDDIEDA
jgi:hypothetical protein